MPIKNQSGGELAPVIEELRRQRPELFRGPDFWRNGLDDIEAAAASLRRGRSEIIGCSAGGRDIRSFAWGQFEPQAPTATISSAMASDRPQAFFDPQKRSRPCLALLGPIHGGETEGIAVCLNLISILETGCDLLGRPQEYLASLPDRMRLLIVPCPNPDGRARAGIRHLCGADVEHIFLVQQGVRRDGQPFKGRSIKELQPVPPGDMLYLGAYYNDEGVNLQHDDFFGPALAPENRALASLFRREIPDGFLSWHSHGSHPGLTGADAYLSPGYQRRQTEASFYILSRLNAAGVTTLEPSACTGPPWSFYFQTFLHHATGALPLLCELPHGISQCPYSLEEIIDIGFDVLRAWAEFALRYGLRPGSHDYYPPPPAG